MKTEQKRITDFRVSWTADHEQYWQGRGTAFTDYDTCATGCGSTLREAIEDALDSLIQNDLRFTDEQEKELHADLVSQIKEPEMLDWDIVKGYCDVQGEHTEQCQQCEGQGIPDMECPTCHDEGVVLLDENDTADCAVCAGEWHYYVSIDVKVAQ